MSEKQFCWAPKLRDKAAQHCCVSDMGFSLAHKWQTTIIDGGSIPETYHEAGTALSDIILVGHRVQSNKWVYWDSEANRQPITVNGVVR